MTDEDPIAALKHAVIHLYLASEMHQSAFERLSEHLPQEAKSDIAQDLADAQEVLLSAYKALGGKTGAGKSDEGIRGGD
jgi:hypothetical protein